MLSITQGSGKTQSIVTGQSLSRIDHADPILLRFFRNLNALQFGLKKESSISTIAVLITETKNETGKPIKFYQLFVASDITLSSVEATLKRAAAAATEEVDRQKSFGDRNSIIFQIFPTSLLATLNQGIADEFRSSGHAGLYILTLTPVHELKTFPYFIGVLPPDAQNKEMGQAEEAIISQTKKTKAKSAKKTTVTLTKEETIEALRSGKYRSRDRTFDNALFRKEAFKDADGRIDLSGAFLSKLDLSSVDLSHVILTKADMTHTYLVNANMSNADLTEADLTDANLFNVKLIGAILIRANLSAANLCSAILIGADFTDAILAGALLVGANATDAILIRANVTSAIVKKTILIGADLTDAKGLETTTRGYVRGDVTYPLEIDSRGRAN
ncbi:Pentapeptide repeats (8 copies) [Candidatus Gugararchaeum adminiculabundum]|nr:Pentapeptide repeats (8 copies) [Candidatus Gugararchaeum adminiculabundum]